MQNETRGRNRQFSDEQLRSDLKDGLKASQIATKYNVSAQAVHKRINQLELTTVSAAVAPVESERFVSTSTDAMSQLMRSLERVNLLSDACDDWLRDAKNPDRYNIDARANEILVTYWDFDDNVDPPKMKRMKCDLQTLINRVEKRFEVDKSELKFSDPRELILKTATEIRQTVGAAVELAQLLADARAMQQFREAMLAAIAKVSPDVAQQIAESVRSVLVLKSAIDGPGSLSATGRQRSG